MQDFLQGKKHIHFIGIGGSGMYPLAQILRVKGYFLTGSDNNETDTLEAVRKMGIEVFLGHSPENIKGADLVIYTAAILPDNPELLAAKASVQTLERRELLGLVTSWYDNCICVAGTHGKTTATSMLTHIMLAGGIDTSAFIGGKLKLIGGSGRVGSTGDMVCEACEFSDTFLKMHPDISVILNIDNDHMDYFKTLDNLKLSFTKFCDKTTNAVIVNGDDINTMEAVKNSSAKKIITFGFSDKNDYYPVDIQYVSDFETKFILMYKGEKVEDITVFVPGVHNVLNATAACTAALYTGCKPMALKEGLAGFTGTGRRFERLAEINGIVIVDDYAHHPAELKATLETAKRMKFKRVWAVFQPFTFSRTANLLDEFAEVLQMADKVVLTPIMAGREKNDYGIESKHLADKIQGCICTDSFEQTAQYVAEHAESGDLVLTMGCGDVYKAAKMMIEIMT